MRSFFFSEEPLHKLRAIGPFGVHMVVDEDALVLHLE